ncbi:MAG: sensor histidine kinase KdpD [Oscillospiraceae bacterium]|nr:sensor histidine kinase KdpD [Oscillospiraceae bacterium]
MSTTNHVLTCLSGAPSNKQVVEFAAQLAKSMGADFTALYVEPAPGSKAKKESARRLQESTAMAEKLGAHIVTVYGGDTIAQIAEYARRSQVTHIVLGQPGGFWASRKSSSRRLAELVPEIRLCVVPTAKPGSYFPQTPVFSRPSLSWRDFCISVGMVMLCTAAGRVLEAWGLEVATIGQVYILGVLVIGLVTSGWGYSVFGAIAGVLACNFFFAAPIFSFASESPGYPLTLMVMLTVGLIVSSLTLNARKQALTAADKAWSTEILLRHSTLLQDAEGQAEALGVLCAQIEKLMGSQVESYLADSKGALVGTWENSTDEEAARAAWQRRQETGAGTSLFPEASRLYLPVMGKQEAFAVIGVRPGRHHRIEPFLRNLVEAMVEQCGLALEKYSVEKERDAARRKAEQENLRANLLRSISHDLRTPLTSICGSAGVLRETGAALTEEKRKELYTDIYEDSLWLIELVENLLAITRIENGIINLKTEPQLVEDIFAEALDHMDKRHQEHRVETQLEEELLMAEMDSSLIVQVLVNLLNNAIKYTPPGSNILLSARSEGENVRFAVADDGPGVPEEERKKLFDMFYTSGKRRGDGRRGLGLGLSLCRSIVLAHGGTIEMRPNRPQGSVFTFTLKRKEMAEFAFQ